MAFVDTGDVVSGTIITEGWGDQVRANFLAGVPAIFSVKGDLAVATAPLTAARLAVGADDSTLLADSSTATGLAWQLQPAARVYSNAAIDPAVGSWHTVNFTHERFDTDGLWAIGSPSRLVIPAGGAGLYIVGGNVEFDTGAGAGEITVGARILLDGTTVIAQYLAMDDNDGPATDRNISALYSLAAGNFLELQVYTSGDINVLSVGNFSPEFWAIWQRRA
jgi:hypothetical protein